MINELSKQIHQNAKDHGFYDKEKNIGEMLCLIHSEVSEALEADRVGRYASAGKSILENLASDRERSSFENTMFMEEFKVSVKDSFEDELSDIIIRVLDLAGYKGIDLESHIKAKIRYNSMREHKHGKKY